MPKLYRILWTLAILVIVITAVIFSFGAILIGAAGLALFGVYRHFFPNKRFAKHKMKPKEYTFGEVIDVKAEVIDITAEVIDCNTHPKKPY